LTLKSKKSGMMPLPDRTVI